MTANFRLVGTFPTFLPHLRRAVKVLVVITVTTVRNLVLPGPPKNEKPLTPETKNYRRIAKTPK